MNELPLELIKVIAKKVVLPRYSEGHDDEYPIPNPQRGHLRMISRIFRRATEELLSVKIAKKLQLSVVQLGSVESYFLMGYHFDEAKFAIFMSSYTARFTKQEYDGCRWSTYLSTALNLKYHILLDRLFEVDGLNFCSSETFSQIYELLLNDELKLNNFLDRLPMIDATFDFLIRRNKQLFPRMRAIIQKVDISTLAMTRMEGAVDMDKYLKMDIVTNEYELLERHLHSFYFHSIDVHRRYPWIQRRAWGLPMSVRKELIELATSIGNPQMIALLESKPIES